MITISLCCNDPDNGNFAGTVAAIEIHGTDGCDIRLEPRRFPDPRLTMVSKMPKRFRAHREDRAFRIARFVFPCLGWTNWYGNWCWDATRMSAREVLRLCRVLRHAGWHVDEADVRFGEVWDSGAEITPQLLEAALSPDVG
jgi:hypothetical protein